MLQDGARFQSRCPSTSRAFTLIELLVVVAIIALLISILLPSLGRAREQTKGAVCSSNLHQLGIATEYYLRDNRDIIPYIRGTQNGDTQCERPEGGPYRQYDQIYNFWTYIKDLKIFRCPSARGENSVTSFIPADAEQTGADPNAYYFVVKSDEQFLNRAYAQQWFPWIDPAADALPVIRELYTEYWYNDWGKCARANLPGNITKWYPAISGGELSRIPRPNQVVLMTDTFWWIHRENNRGKYPEKLRHFEAHNFLFLDGHVDRIKWQNFYDEKIPGKEKRDYDQNKNRPFYAWGLAADGVPIDGDS